MSDQDNPQAQSSEEAWHTGPLYGLPPLKEPLDLSPPNRDTQAVRAAILEKLQAVRDDGERLALSALWNATLPINRLPNEIFTDIFLDFTNPFDSGFLPMWNIHPKKERRATPSARPFGWLPLTLVCRHWWAVARTTPKLWRTIEIDEQGDVQQLLQLALQRSGTATLDVTFYVAKVAVAAVPILTPHVARLRGLILPEADKANLPSLLSLFDCGMPLLDRLTVYGDLVLRRGSNPVDEGYMPVVLPGTRFPSLTYLYLSSVAITVHSLPPSLRTLTISRCAFERATSLSAFLGVLQSCRALEDLCLEGFPANMSLESTASSTKLPKLKHLVVDHEETSRIVRFLEVLHFPPNASFSFSGRHSVPDPPRFSSLLPRNFTSRFSVCTSVHSVDIHITEIHMEMSLGGSALKLQPWGTHAVEFGKAWSCLGELPALLDTSRVTHLSLRGVVSGAEEDDWRSLFEGMLFVERLELYCYGTNIQRLFIALSSTSPDDLSQLVGGSLRDITTHGSDWNDSIMDALKSFLTSRMQRRVPLLRLRFQCRFYNEAEFLAKKADFYANVAPCHQDAALTFECSGFNHLPGDTDLEDSDTD